MGGTAGRTTLNGEGLQHEDGHSHLQASLIPNCVAYDPAYGYELAVIIHDGLRRMFAEQEDVFYYLTMMNENYAQPALPEGAEEGILRGMHRIAGDEDGRRAPVRLLGSGTILREVLAGAELLREDFGVAADVWSVTSFTELRRDGLEAERDNRLHPTRAPRASYVQESLGDSAAPVVAATDYMRTLPDLIRPWVDAPYTVLGTDGFGRSDYRARAAAVLRGGPPPRRRRRAARARPRRGCGAGDRQVRDRRGGGGTVAAVGTPRDVAVPDIGDFVDVPVIEILVEAGQHVAEEEPLVVLESDKATMEVPAPFAGVVAELKVAVGDKVSEGTTLLVLDVAGGNGASAPPAEEQRRPASEAGAPRSVESAIAAEVQSRGAGARRRPRRRRHSRQLGRAGLRLAGGAATGPRARHRSVGRAGQRSQGADHQGGPRSGPLRPRPAAAAAGPAAVRGQGRARPAHPHPAALARRAARGRGRRSRTSPSTRRPTSRTSRRSASS